MAHAVGAACTAASHAGWMVTTVAGLAIALIGLVAASPWCRHRAEQVVGDLA